MVVKVLEQNIKLEEVSTEVMKVKDDLEAMNK